MKNDFNKNIFLKERTREGGIRPWAPQWDPFKNKVYAPFHTCIVGDGEEERLKVMERRIRSHIKMGGQVVVFDQGGLLNPLCKDLNGTLLTQDRLRNDLTLNLFSWPLFDTSKILVKTDGEPIWEARVYIVFKALSILMKRNHGLTERMEYQFKTQMNKTIQEKGLDITLQDVLQTMKDAQDEKLLPLIEALEALLKAEEMYFQQYLSIDFSTPFLSVEMENTPEDPFCEFIPFLMFVHLNLYMLSSQRSDKPIMVVFTAPHPFIDQKIFKDFLELFMRSSRMRYAGILVQGETSQDLSPGIVDEMTFYISLGVKGLSLSIEEEMDLEKEELKERKNQLFASLSDQDIHAIFLKRFKKGRLWIWPLFLGLNFLLFKVYHYIF